MRDFQAPGRSAVYAPNAMAVTSHPLATQAALSALQKGGNAVDAAITAAAVLCVAEPHMVGIGGDCFALVSEPDGSVHGLNASGRAPLAADPDILREQGLTEVPLTSAHAVTVPGAVTGFHTLLDRFGTIGLDRALGPAIDFAKKGVPVAPRVAGDWALAHSKLEDHAGARKHLLPNGTPPAAGDRVTFPALAGTLTAIAANGPSALYSGPIADDIVATIVAAGGTLCADDLAAVSADWVEPIVTTYRGHEIVELPPNGHGATALLILNILEQFDLAALAPQSAERLHLHMEASRAAFAVRDTHLADPDHMTVAPGELHSADLARSLARQIDPARRTEKFGFALPSGSDTVYLTVADPDGRIVSLIASLYKDFGSGLVTETTGIVLQNRGACFNLIDGHPNCYGPGKRPLHTIIPGLVRKDNRTIAGFGVMGGHYQPSGHAHVLSNILDHGMDPQQALDSPRLFFDDDGALLYERGIAENVRSALAAMGHRLELSEKPIGGGQMIWRDMDRNCLIGGSDPRKDGCALGF
ncbi:MAG: gamma-glutamyltransferase [Alphaproteobacteria bacterium]